MSPQNLYQNKYLRSATIWKYNNLNIMFVFHLVDRHKIYLQMKKINYLRKYSFLDQTVIAS
jgi:hypothetical protein